MSNANFGTFLESHGEALSTVNTDGKYKDLLDLLKPKSDAYIKWLEKHDITTINRKGKTIDVNKVLIDFKRFIKDEVHKEVSCKFEKKNQAIFNAFFPKGLSEYSNINKKNAKVLIGRIVTACSTYKAELPAGLDTQAAAFSKDFELSYSTQLASKSNVKDASSEGDTLRAEAAKVLYVNLLRLLLMHADNPKQVLNLYDLTVSGKIKAKKKEKVALAMA